jgi:hypothetical protein
MWAPTLIVTICGFLFLIPEYGIVGASLTVTASFLVIFTLILVYYMRLTGTGLRELLIVRSEDVRVFVSIASSTISRKPITVNSGVNNAIATISNQNKVETPGVVS